MNYEKDLNVFFKECITNDIANGLSNAKYLMQNNLHMKLHHFLLFIMQILQQMN